MLSLYNHPLAYHCRHTPPHTAHRLWPAVPTVHYNRHGARLAWPRQKRDDVRSETPAGHDLSDIAHVCRFRHALAFAGFDAFTRPF
jgi:hypothetical protein